jgi:hypothetical protein
LLFSISNQSQLSKFLFHFNDIDDLRFIGQKKSLKSKARSANFSLRCHTKKNQNSILKRDDMAVTAKQTFLVFLNANF